MFLESRNQSTPNTPVKNLDFSFPIKGLSNLNFLQGWEKKASKQLHCRLILEITMDYSREKPNGGLRT